MIFQKLRYTCILLPIIYIPKVFNPFFILNPFTLRFKSLVFLVLVLSLLLHLFPASFYNEAVFIKVIIGELLGTQEISREKKGRGCGPTEKILPEIALMKIEQHFLKLHWQNQYQDLSENQSVLICLDLRELAQTILCLIRDLKCIQLFQFQRNI